MPAAAVTYGQAGSFDELPASGTLGKSGRRVYSPPGSGPAKRVPHDRNARQKAAQQRAGARAATARRQQIATTAAAPAPAAAPQPAAARPAPSAPPAAAAAAPGSPSTGGVKGAYQQRVAGPVRQAYQNRSIGQEGAGALLALFLYPLLVNALRGGPARARGWLGAKFVNKPYGNPASSKGPGPVTTLPKRTGPAPNPIGKAT